MHYDIKNQLDEAIIKINELESQIDELQQYYHNLYCDSISLSELKWIGFDRICLYSLIIFIIYKFW